MDVYGFGHVSTGRLLRLRDPFPAADGYGEVVEDLENHSGEATGTALVLARLGLEVRLEGNWIGDNEPCRRTLAFLASRGIDVSGLRVQPGYAGVQEVVIADGGSRTVFGRYCDLLFTTPQWDMPTIDRLRGARVAVVDPAFGEATLRVARAACELGIPLATCDCGPDTELARSASILAVSNEFLRREFPGTDLEVDAREALFQRYLQVCPGLVVFTSGAGRLRHGRKGGAQGWVEPFRVPVVDSAGAGDSFRGGLVWGALQGWDDQRTVRFAAALAARICTTTPGCVHPPTLAEIEELLLAPQVRSE
jgi:sugar/nucleoside kinase (ribokinase family)